MRKNKKYHFLVIFLLISFFIYLVIKLNKIEKRAISKEPTIEMIEICDITDLDPKYNLYSVLLAFDIPHPDIVLRQAILETGNFKSKRMQECNNIFGIMYGNQLKEYDHWIECVIDYKRLFSNKYKGGDYYKFLENCGYSTSPNYTRNLKQINLK